jgi:hypothetical protein
MNAYGVLLTFVLTDNPPIQSTITLLLRRFVPNRFMIHEALHGGVYSGPLRLFLSGVASHVSTLINRYGGCQLDFAVHYRLAISQLPSPCIRKLNRSYCIGHTQGFKHIP